MADPPGRPAAVRNPAGEPPGATAEEIWQAANQQATDQESPEATVKRLLGRAPTPDEMAEARFYGSMRSALLAARDDASLSQTDVAKRLNVGQSEVSRLETSVGPGTRLGRLRNYLTACGAQLSLVVRTASGRSLAAGDQAHAAAVTATQAGLAGAYGSTHKSAFSTYEITGAAYYYPFYKAGELTSMPCVGTGQVTGPVIPQAEPEALIDHILAFDAAMTDEGVAPEQVTRLRRAFLMRLRPRQHAAATNPVASHQLQSLNPLIR